MLTLVLLFVFKCSTREKEKGNDCYKSQEYGDSIEYYSKAITLNPHDIPLYTNRAMANIKLQNYDKAIEDCNLALQKDNKFMKAYWRRGICNTKSWNMHLRQTSYVICCLCST